MAFINKLKDKGNKYIVGWDTNESHNSDTVIDLLQETEMVDTFLEFFLTHPATHSQGTLQIDLISISLTLLKFVKYTFLLDPTNSQSDYSCISIDFNLAKLLKQSSLLEVDPSHHQSQNLVLTDVKGQTKYLKDLKKHQLAHNIQNQMHNLYD
jgi:hypothetical protein